MITIMEIVNHLFIKRKDQSWAEMNVGLPTPKGTIIPVLKATSDGTFYLFSNKGVYQSVDGVQIGHH